VLCIFFLLNFASLLYAFITGVEKYLYLEIRTILCPAWLLSLGFLDLVWHSFIANPLYYRTYISLFPNSYSYLFYNVGAYENLTVIDVAG
jgi:hypothetical protein